MVSKKDLWQTEPPTQAQQDEAEMFQNEGSLRRDDDDDDDDILKADLAAPEQAPNPSRKNLGTSSKSTKQIKNNSHHSHGDNNSITTNNYASPMDRLAKNETFAVWALRAILICVFLGSPVLVSIGVFRYLRQQQDDEFEQSWKVTAESCWDLLENKVHSWLAGADALALTRVTLANELNQTFPFSSLPNTGVYGHQALLQAKPSRQWIETLIVEANQREEWQEYAQEHNQWVDQVTHAMQQNAGNTNDQEGISTNHQQRLSYDICYNQVPIIPREQQGPNHTVTYAVNWHAYPHVNSHFPMYNGDMLTTPGLQDLYQMALQVNQVLFSRFLVEGDTMMDQSSSSSSAQEEKNPYVAMVMPLVDRGDHMDVSSLATEDIEALPNYGFYTFETALEALFTHLIPETVKGIQVVARNRCQYNQDNDNADAENTAHAPQEQEFVYQLNAKNVTFVGDAKEDETIINKEFLHLQQSQSLMELLVDYTGPPAFDDCIIIDIAPTTNQYRDDEPRIFAVAAVAVYVFTSFLLIVYDLIISRRQSIVMKAAVQSTSIVSSLFPSQVRDRLFDIGNAISGAGGAVVGGIAGAGGAVVGGIGRGLGFRMRRASAGSVAQEQAQPAQTRRNSSLGASGKGAAADFAGGIPSIRASPPVADLYPEATVMFADIAGFTAWCSAREPSQVFILLETLYAAFDESANKRRVFKVETIGDSYVAVVGLPDERIDHAVVMVRFARDCLDSMTEVCNSLIVELGPDTADLALRVGLHSGAVTAGVLRGQKARFQLFGDTVNTAARMESNGVRGRIQASESTVEALEAHGKGHWAEKRDDLIDAKGKGTMQTYWVSPKNATSSRETDSNSASVASAKNLHEEDWQATKLEGLISWNTDTMYRLLQRVVASRGFLRNNVSANAPSPPGTDKSIIFHRSEGIHFVPAESGSSQMLELSPAVKQQIKEFVTEVASMHSDLPFHSFEKTTHIALSLNTMINRAQKSQDDLFFASDPIAEFACLFAVLIHSIEHPGVSNRQLIAENDEKVGIYHGRCLNEQHAFNCGMELLMSDKYQDLQNVIASTKDELARFRQVVVNCVLATDLLDPNLQDERRDQWEQCFGENAPSDLNNQRATIFMEYVVQAAVVGPFMQHQHVFQKWFERLVLEVHQAFQVGRTNKTVDYNWYQHQVEMFDFVVIPLATKLNATGFLGGIGREHLDYAKQNRVEFVEKGESYVRTLVHRIASGERQPLLTHQDTLTESAADDEVTPAVIEAEAEEATKGMLDI